MNRVKADIIRIRKSTADLRKINKEIRQTMADFDKEIDAMLKGQK